MLFSMSFTVKPGAAERSLRVSGPLRTGRAGRAAALRAGAFRRAVAALRVFAFFFFVAILVPPTKWRGRAGMPYPPPAPR